ncbi:MAG: glycosyltransferase family 4 protein [Pirellulaceae bacterium]|nr:glycosyltransferase family 4 protein [Pirellulaceae bacterium]
MRTFKHLPSVDQMHVVVLTNYLRRHHALVFQQVAKRVGKLTILLSTDMEPDRQWEADWGGLDVQLQKNWMLTAKWKHSAGFEEPNFIHFPVDTIKQLRRLNPDVVFSYELGMRTMFCALFGMLRRQVPIVAVGNMADHIERERGPLRRLMRRFLRTRVDFATYNGPSCKRYLQNLGFSDDRLFHFPYCIDMDKAYAGEKSFNADGYRRLVYLGAISSRKGILPFTKAIADYLQSNDTVRVTLAIAGDGPLADAVAQLANDRLEIDLLGNCDASQLAAAYQSADICAFPTLGDEWGLVPVEALASGLPVLGSCLAQSVETIIVDEKNGWSFDPTDSDSLRSAIDRALRTSQADLEKMSVAARRSAVDSTPEASAERFHDILRALTGDVSESPVRDDAPSSVGSLGNLVP